MPIRIHVTSVPVDDQEKALAFYTEQLGFAPKTDVPVGEHRWLTVVGLDDPEGVELLLEPDQHPASKAFKAALTDDGIPIASFAVEDVAVTYRELEQRGVIFVQPPTTMGEVTTAVLDDTCGNLIQILQVHDPA